MTLRRVGWLLAAAALAAGQTHKTPVSANWYPSEPAALEKLLDQAFDFAAKRAGAGPPRSHLRALIAPHAALVYSGVVAAAAYRRLETPRNVIVLAFSHRRPLEGVYWPDLAAYATPLGEIKLNRRALEELSFIRTPEDRLCDHSLENQLPFLKRVAGEAQVLPLYVGSLSEGALAAAAKKLAARVKEGDVLVASSDLTHYGRAYGYTPFPNDAQLPKRLMQRAAETFDAIGSLDVACFDRHLEQTRDTLCGVTPIRLLLATLRLLDQEVYLAPLDYLTSGDLTRDYSSSVGYGALAFHEECAWGAGKEAQRKMLASARKTLDGYLATGKKLRVPVPPEQREPELGQRTGLFVTIKKDGKLRGCVGGLSPALPLWDAVAERTLAAAEDPRFKPLTAKEAPVSLEISLLTPLKRLRDWRRFRLGLGGVITLGGKSGLLLPQIAREQHWTRAEQFLENLALKAGLEPKAYRDPRTVLYVYSAQVFAEGSE